MEPAGILYKTSLDFLQNLVVWNAGGRGIFPDQIAGQEKERARQRIFGEEKYPRCQ